MKILPDAMSVSLARLSILRALLILFGLIYSNLGSAHHALGFIGTDVPRSDADSWNEAVGINFQANVRGWAWERGGQIWINDETSPLTTPFLDISEEVGAWHDHGLPGLATLSDFGNNTREIQFAPGVADIGQHTITVDVTDDAISPLGDSTDLIVTVTAMASNARVSSGLVVFYPLTEGVGT